MATVVISPVNVVNFLDGGGHFWVYMQYVQGLQQLGCETYWLERFRSSGDQARDALVLATFAERMEGYGLAGQLILYERHGQSGESSGYTSYIGMTLFEAESIFRRADLLLNFDYSIDPTLLACFRRTALVDIDPGLLQFWMAARQVHAPPHDVYLTTGETVGTPSARFPDCGLPWFHIRPPVCLECWPYVHDPGCEVFTTVSNWNSVDWIVYGTEHYNNTKRGAFLEFVELPQRTSQRLELALLFGDENAPERLFGDEDVEDMRLLADHGWRVRHSRLVARTPQMYQAYIQGSRGEFSCAKPSCMKFQNAWISDRTLCYLATGKPVVVQNTGPSSFLPNGEGMFRFDTIGEAADALATVNRDYERHCRAARAIAEAYFDAKHTVRAILNVAL